MAYIITAGNLPAGYSAADYFSDTSIFARQFPTREEAQAVINAAYKGPDVDGVEPTIEIESA